MLIIIKEDNQFIRSLRRTLDSFSCTTGLTINYHKSTFIPSREGLGLDNGSNLRDAPSLPFPNFTLASHSPHTNLKFQTTNH